MCVVHRKHYLFIYYIFIRNKKVIYSLSWPKRDKASAASREVPMTKEVVNSLTNLGKIIVIFLFSYFLKPLLELMHLPDAILYFDDNVDLHTRHRSFYLVSFLIIFLFILLYLCSTTTKGHRVGEVAHDYVPALKQWLNGKVWGPAMVKIILIIFFYPRNNKTVFAITCMCFINNYMYCPNYFYLYELILRLPEIYMWCLNYCFLCMD